MSVNVVNTVVIDRPVADVSEYTGDPDNAPLWYKNIKSVEWKTPRPMRIGSQIDFVAHFLGRRLAYTYKVVDFVPGKHLRMRTGGAPFPNGDDIQLGKRRRGNADDAAESWPSERLLRLACASDVVHGRQGKQERPGAVEATS